MSSLVFIRIIANTNNIRCISHDKNKRTTQFDWCVTFMSTIWMVTLNDHVKNIKMMPFLDYLLIIVPNWVVYTSNLVESLALWLGPSSSFFYRRGRFELRCLRLQFTNVKLYQLNYYPLTMSSWAKYSIICRQRQVTSIW